VLQNYSFPGKKNGSEVNELAAAECNIFGQAKHVSLGLTCNLFTSFRNISTL